ncbi:MAG: hypothetical protein JXK05_00320 [Campylobacterales bacterium]|nr:hypothetical protein [Campylobacterales bacterium]
MTNRSMAIDATGKIHVAYGEKHLYYAYFDGTVWHVSTIDTADNVGRYASVAVDDNGKVHIAYFDAANGNLKYASNKTGTWQTMLVSSVAGKYSVVAVKSGATPQAGIAFFDEDTDDLKYATISYTNMMTSSTVDSVGDVGSHLSLAIDQNNGNPHISYYDATNKRLKYAMKPGSGAWDVQIAYAQPSVDVGRFSSIALDSSGYAHISFSDFTNSRLKYITNSGGSWSSVETPDTTHSAGWYTSIGVDANDNVHVSYYDSVNKDLYYVNRTTSWATPLAVVTDSDSGQFSALALDGTNKAHIVFFKDTTTYETLGYAYQYDAYGGPLWATVTLDQQSIVSGRKIKIAVDAQDFLHLLYYNQDIHQLKYANNRTGTWEEVIVSFGSCDSDNSLALDGNGYAHIAYDDESMEALYYISNNDSGSWHRHQVASGAGSPWYSNDIAVDSLGVPHISFFDSEANELKHAIYAIGVVYVEPFIDTAAGALNAIAIDGNDGIHISYASGTLPNTRLKYAVKTESTWSKNFFDLTPGAGLYTDIVARNDGKVHIVYGVLSGDLIGIRYQSNASGEWLTQTIHTDGWNPGIAMDRQNKLHVAYGDDSEKRAMYATQAGSGWRSSFYENDAHIAMTGQGGNIAVDSQGYLYIADVDFNSGGLLYAKGKPTVMQPALMMYLLQ